MPTAELAGEVAALRPLLLRLARLQLRNEGWAEDAVSETLVAALEGLDRFGGRSQLQTWVVGILKHKILDQFRRGGREVALDAEECAALPDEAEDLFRPDGHRASRPASWGDPEENLRQAQFLEVLQACVDQLPPAQGRLFLLREWMEMETNEICKELGLTPTNCFVLLHRARTRLRECLESRWIGGDRAGSGR